MKGGKTVALQKLLIINRNNKTKFIVLKETESNPKE
jgi:hypothetical protein